MLRRVTITFDTHNDDKDSATVVHVFVVIVRRTPCDI
jgi:hypothetical protein